MPDNRKKVLILGDSYATKIEDLRFSNSPDWTALLEKNPKYVVTNLAKGASSLWFSFKNFLEHQNNYDKIIFVVTEPYRIYYPIKDEPGFIHHTTGNLDRLLSYRQKLKKTQPNHPDIEKITTIELYFKYIIDFEGKELHQKMMIKEVRELRPDTVLIPAFSSSIFDYRGDCLMDISDQETRHFGLSIFNMFSTRDECRKCHMIDENNQIFYEHVLRWLDGETVIINKNDFKKMASSDIERYIPRRTDIKSK